MITNGGRHGRRQDPVAPRPETRVRLGPAATDEVPTLPALLEAALRRLAGFLAPALDLTELRLEDGAGTWRACLRARVRRGEDWSDDPIEIRVDLPRSSHGDARHYGFN